MKKVAELRDNINILVNRLNEKGEMEFAADIEEIINSCGRYIESINSMEAAITSARFRLEGNDYREYVMNLDKSRRLTHNSLIVSVKLLNRYCRLAEMDPIYKGDMESRIEIAEFAQNVVNEMFDTRKL